MKQSDYKLWLDYRYGEIDRALTEKEYHEILASDFAMHLLVPTDALLEKCGGIENLKNMKIWENFKLIMKWAKEFCVSEDVVIIKIICLQRREDFLKQVEEKKKNKQRERIL